MYDITIITDGEHDIEFSTELVPRRMEPHDDWFIFGEANSYIILPTYTLVAVLVEKQVKQDAPYVDTRYADTRYTADIVTRTPIQGLPIQGLIEPLTELPSLKQEPTPNMGYPTSMGYPTRDDHWR